MPLLEQAVGAAILGGLALSVAAWLWALGRWRRGEPLLAFEPRRPAPWTILDLLAVFIFYVAVQVAAGAALRAWFGRPIALEEATAEQFTMLLLAQGTANLATAAAAIALIRLRAGAAARELGLSLAMLPRDLAVGAAAFVMLAPPVLALQAALVQWYPSEHPLVVMLRERPHGPLFASGVFVAVIVAPLVEEFAFRVLLQGWLEKASLPPEARRAVKTKPPPALPDASPAPRADSSSAPLMAELVAPPGEDRPEVPPYEAEAVEPRAAQNEALETEPVESGAAEAELIAPPPSARPPYWPIVVSAAVFALLHFTHGPDPIPLFLLALGLGYLYRQTHRLAPSVVVHFLLNALSMTILWLEMTRRG